MKPLALAIVRSVLRFRVLLGAFVWIGIALLVSAAQRGEGSDTTLIGTLGGLTLPLTAFTFALSFSSGESLKAAVSPWLCMGATRRHVYGLVLGLPIVSSSIVGAILGVVIVLLTRAPTGAPWDAATTAWIAALGGATYAAVFLAASTFGKRGGGRGFALALDFVLGASTGPLGVVTVRGHVRNLLGGAPPAELGQRASSLWLLALFVIALSIALYRLRPAPARVSRASDRGALA